MRNARIECPRCGADWPPARLNGGRFEPCARCGVPSRLHAWPALYRPDENTTRAQAIAAGDAACFHHPDKLAVVACEDCGRFLCGLCDLELNGHHRCTSCVQQERATAAAGRGGFEPRRVLYDNLALGLAVLPILFFPFWFMSFICAPAAVFIAIRFWRRPLSILPRTRIRFVIAFLCAVAEIVGWVFLAWILYQNATTAGGSP